MVGNAPAVLEHTNTGLELGMTPNSLLFDALIPALEEVGARFERGDFFVPEMLISGKAMSGAGKSGGGARREKEKSRGVI